MQLSRRQAYLTAFLVMVGAVVTETLLSSVLSARVSLAVISFLFVILLMAVFDRSPMPGWRRTTLTSKVIFGGVMALAPPALILVRSIVFGL